MVSILVTSVLSADSFWVNYHYLPGKRISLCIHVWHIYEFLQHPLYNLMKYKPQAFYDSKKGTVTVAR
ncbi:hypothetical protein CW304_21470 [Bacillus sp. UFRGS-B20]|nr:hypothetical protein CW304_21470 [Bacillus sp. UFRGS-B20]